METYRLASWAMIIMTGLMAVVISSAQVDVFKAGASYGLTLSQSADWGSDMYRYTGTIKYGPIRLFPWKKRFVSGERLDTPSVVAPRGYVSKDSAEKHRVELNEQALRMPSVSDSVYSRYPISITTVGGYSYLYDAPAEGGLFKNDFDQSGVYGGFIINVNQGMIKDWLFGGDTESDWIDPFPVEWRPYFGIGFTFISATSVNAELDLSSFNGISDTLTGNVVLAMPSALAVDLMCGIGFTFERKISVVLGLSFTSLFYENVILTTVEDEIEDEAKERVNGGLSMSYVGLHRTNGMVGISINL